MSRLSVALLSFFAPSAVFLKMTWVSCTDLHTSPRNPVPSTFGYLQKDLLLHSFEYFLWSCSSAPPPYWALALMCLSLVSILQHFAHQSRWVQYCPRSYHIHRELYWLRACGAWRTSKFFVNGTEQMYCNLSIYVAEYRIEFCIFSNHWDAKNQNRKSQKECSW